MRYRMVALKMRSASLAFFIRFLFCQISLRLIFLVAFNCRSFCLICTVQ